MVDISPFRGIRYNQKKIRDVSRVIAPPYDVISEEERERLSRRSPYNIVRLILNQEPDSYESVARLFEEWQSEGVFEQDETPAIYFLVHRFPDGEGRERDRQGFIALSRLEDLSTGTIRPHEQTLEAPKEDRLQLMLACHANFSPIFALYSQPKPIINRRLAEQVLGVSPLIEVKVNSQESCRLWRVTDLELIHLVQQEIKGQPLLIADGHHRYEAALNYRNRLLKEGGKSTGRERSHYVMMYFANMNDENLVILPTHRLVRNFPPIPFQNLEEALQRYFYLEPYPKTPEGQQWFLRALRSGGKKRRLIGASFKRDPRYLILRLKSKRIMQRLAKEMSAPLRELDVTTVHLLIFGHILGLTAGDQTSDSVISYSQDAKKVLRSVDRDDYQAAFILNPPRPEEILTISASGEKMPQKSTYFYPKLVTGLVINRIDPNEEISDEVVGR
ncbi:MAG: DUF1015 domain-containing protein [Candidatus Binatia bacterium]